MNWYFVVIGAMTNCATNVVMQRSISLYVCLSSGNSVVIDPVNRLMESEYIHCLVIFAPCGTQELNTPLERA